MNCAFFMYLYEYLVVDDNLNKIVKEGNGGCQMMLVRQILLKGGI